MTSPSSHFNFRVRRNDPARVPPLGGEVRGGLVSTFRPGCRVGSLLFTPGGVSWYNFPVVPDKDGGISARTLPFVSPGQEQLFAPGLAETPYCSGVRPRAPPENSDRREISDPAVALIITVRFLSLAHLDNN